ncbi:aspartyl aminopeptidase [Desulfosporosinus orientis DSM 765]|uniref:M18 family aminopeptidase n=1 Tax=Desulfosporosinus orientis (strain ATCC 19365 / DSM 765 / NCIMB 8382 / VKM B-1628 / Singapore I) TaxID=768706 RepID=G7WI59_DESOD|nr:aminopeptidase [Desulfosporosinus orientis]AET70982.1 aspartyl aminopeptidase [Desulfosporosinus orientis DSM 765]
MGQKKVATAWDELTMSEQELRAMQEYLSFLSQGKTERESWQIIERYARGEGFISLDEATNFTPGQRISLAVRGKAGILAIGGLRPLQDGFRLIAAHVDAPRLDIKQRPLYEEEGLGFLKTHYYGGIKKYQWTSLPLALHGIVVLSSGQKVDIVIGEDEEDPIFTIADLLPHLAKEQNKKKLNEAIPGESLNLLLGHNPSGGEGEERVKSALLLLLKDKYGIEEEDFVSAELEVVPAGKARYSGLDRSFIVGYGQDDRICSFAAWKALQAIEVPEWSTIVLLADKEEIGSDSNTGMKARFFENLIAELITLQNGSYDGLKVRRALARAKALSGDVTGGYDPNYAEVMDKRNAAFLGRGLVICKYTGSGGKYGTNDANPEFVAEVREIFDNAKIAWQTAELGKIDAGGGGTIAQYMAVYGMEVIDCGVGILSMHAPWEISSIADLVMLMRGYHEFLKYSG